MKQTDLKVNAQRQTMKTLGVPLWVQWGVSGRHGGVSPAGTVGVPSGVSVQTVPGPGLPSPALCAALSVRSFHYLTGRCPTCSQCDPHRSPQLSAAQP